VMKTWADSVYDDTRNLLEYGFQNFEKVTIADGDILDSLNIIEHNGHVMLPEGVTVQELEMDVIRDEGEENTGSIIYSYRGQNVGIVKVTFYDNTEDIKRAQETVRMLMEKTRIASGTDRISKNNDWTIIVIVGNIIALSVLVITQFISKRKP